jgi:hypothetical protein
MLNRGVHRGRPLAFPAFLEGGPHYRYDVLMAKRSKRPRDLNELASQLVGEAVGETEPTPAPNIERRNGARVGGKARAATLSPERRREIATTAARTRWKTDQTPGN